MTCASRSSRKIWFNDYFFLKGSSKSQDSSRRVFDGLTSSRRVFDGLTSSRRVFERAACRFLFVQRSQGTTRRLGRSLTVHSLLRKGRRKMPAGTPALPVAGDTVFFPLVFCLLLFRAHSPRAFPSPWSSVASASAFTREIRSVPTRRGSRAPGQLPSRGTGFRLFSIRR